MTRKTATGISLFTLGFLTYSVQVYLVRESIVLFMGNELVIGVVLSFWMLLTGLGAWAGRFSGNVRNMDGIVLFLVFLMALSPVFILLLFDLLRVTLFPAGSMVSLSGIAATTLLVQVPFCLASGWLFTVLSGHSGAAGDRKQPGAAYMMESLGSFTAGLLVNFLFLWCFSTFLSMKLVTLTGFLCISLLAWSGYKRGTAWITFWASAVILVFLFITDFEKYTAAWLYPEQTMVLGEETPYGKVTVTRQEGQYNFYENGRLLFSSGNVISNEEAVHPAMIQHPSPRRVLLVSGGFAGTLQEILKYRPVEVDYMEINPSLIRIGQHFNAAMNAPGIHPVRADARQFIRKSSSAYDVVLVNPGEPSTLESNRFFTLEWFRDVKQKLTPGGVVSVSLPTTSDYISGEGRNLNATLYRTLQETFTHVLIIPLGKNYFLASDRVLDIGIPEKIAERGIPTLYVNSFYLDSGQLTERSLYVTENLAVGVGVNHDFRPVALRLQTEYWLSFFNDNLEMISLLLTLLFLLLVFFFTPVTSAIFTAGATGMSFELLLIFSLQVLCGMAYQLVSAVILVFMAGLVIGSRMSIRFQEAGLPRFFLLTLTGLSLTGFILPGIVSLAGLLVLPVWAITIIILFMTLLTGNLIGMQYGVAGRIGSGTVIRWVAGNYSADLLGSALGSMAVTLYLFPVFGLTVTCLILSLLNLVSAGRFLFVRKNSIFMAR